MTTQTQQSLDRIAFSATVRLLFAGVVAFSVDGWLIGRGKGHAVVQLHHAH